MHANDQPGTGCRRQLPTVQENDHRVHQNLVRMMDRRLSNVQLQQHLYEPDTCQQRYTEQSVDQSQEHRRSIVQQPKSGRSSVGRSDSGSERGNDRYAAGYYLGAAKMATRRGEPL
ncbi:uncharacterized protein LOC143265266 [Megachile rotundata]|uniref:uncharacterized protein LOC143265266 n=1 Tax=Megachile rotundata TaxID=143995 RepID=UPI003FCF7B9A